MSFLPQLRQPISFLGNFPRAAPILQHSYTIDPRTKQTLETGRWQLSRTRWPCCILQTFVSRLLKCEYFYNLYYSFHGKYHRILTLISRLTLVHENVSTVLKVQIKTIACNVAKHKQMKATSQFIFDFIARSHA